MARVQWSEQAARDVERLIRTHSLPADTKDRVKRSVRPLHRFPLLGPEIGARGRTLRFLLGPWRWMIVVYVYFDDEDRVVVVAVEDGRTSTATTSLRRS
jgi:plasmid stabilization system protein ParE